MVGCIFVCWLLYEFFVQGKVNCLGKMFGLMMMNIGVVVVYLQVWVDGMSMILWYYMIGVGMGMCVMDVFVLNLGGGYDYLIYGLNGFLQMLCGNIGVVGSVGLMVEVSFCYDVQNGNVLIMLDNVVGVSVMMFQFVDNVYGMNSVQLVSVLVGVMWIVMWYGDVGWYDVSICDVNDFGFLCCIVGCVQV